MSKHEVRAPVTGTIWMHMVGVGQRVAAGQDLILAEVMKCEIPIASMMGGIVSFLKSQGEIVHEGDVVAVVECGEL